MPAFPFFEIQTSLTPIRLSPAVRGSVRVYTTEYSAPVLGGGLSLDLLLLAERLGALQRGGVLFLGARGGSLGGGSLLGVVAFLGLSLLLSLLGVGLGRRRLGIALVGGRLREDGRGSEGSFTLVCIKFKNR